MVRIALFSALLTLLVSPAQAADYAPGTVGYFYKNCQKALEESKTLSEFQATICGAFAEGYAGGAIAVSSGMITAPPATDDPCAAEKQKQYDRINGRVCPNLPKPDPKTDSAGMMLNRASDIVHRWVLFEKYETKSDPMIRTATRQMNKLVTPGKFCDYLETEGPETEKDFVINPALDKISVNDFLKAKKNVSLAAKVEQCRKDVEAAGGDSAKFSGTRCGAEISGYIAGLYSAQHLQKNRATPSKQCKKEIDRLYKNFDVKQTMCVSYDTNPLWVAEIFLKRFPREAKGQSDDIFGVVGYETIYKGLLCAEERKKAD